LVAGAVCSAHDCLRIDRRTGADTRYGCYPHPGTATSSEATTTPVPVSGSGGSGGTVSTRVPTNTPFPTWATKEDNCEFISESPKEYAQPSGENFDKVWTFRNVGTSTWNSATYFVVWRADVPDNQNWSYDITQYNLPHDVAPNETVDIVIDIQVPLGVTNQLRTTYWGIANDKGDIFCRFYHTIPSTY